MNNSENLEIVDVEATGEHVIIVEPTVATETLKQVVETVKESEAQDVANAIAKAVVDAAIAQNAAIKTSDVEVTVANEKVVVHAQVEPKVKTDDVEVKVEGTKVIVTKDEVAPSIKVATSETVAEKVAQEVVAVQTVASVKPSNVTPIETPKVVASAKTGETKPVQEVVPQSNLDVVAKIKVIGVGGGGNNTINSMINEGIQGVEFIVANTDQQALNSSVSDNTIALGKSAKGLGAGAKPEEGKKAALESEDTIRESLRDANMVIIAAGMGGGTGTGAAPIVAKIARELGALTVAIVTTPFSFEGRQRRLNADQGLIDIEKNVDSLIVVSNDKLLKQFGNISLKDSFLYADKVLKQSVRSITDLISVPALINLDFADVTTVMKDKGRSLIGIGRASGEGRAEKAAIAAITSPILEASIGGATHAIINITGSDITLDEAEQAVETIRKQASEEVNIIFGVAIDDALGDEIQIAVIATGLETAVPAITKAATPAKNAATQEIKVAHAIAKDETAAAAQEPQPIEEVASDDVEVEADAFDDIAATEEEAIFVEDDADEAVEETEEAIDEVSQTSELDDVEDFFAKNPYHEETIEKTGTKVQANESKKSNYEILDDEEDDGLPSFLRR